MKPIKLLAANAPALAAALAAANGKATAHTYTSPMDLFSLANDAETQLDALKIKKADRRGARFYAMSGDRLPNAYKHAIRVSRVQIERRGAGWYLVALECAEIYPQGTRPHRLILTEQQDAAAIAALRASYVIA